MTSQRYREFTGQGPLPGAVYPSVEPLAMQWLPYYDQQREIGEGYY